jgi:hypothetical protein
MRFQIVIMRFSLSSMSTKALTRIAVLDDYQRVALKCADWSRLKNQVSIDVYSNTLYDENALVERLHPYSVPCANARNFLQLYSTGSRTLT